MDRNFLIGLIVFILAFILVFGLVKFLDYKYPVSCDIGKNEVTGDYHEHGWNSWMANEPINMCCIEDCEEYNKINPMECVC